MSGMKLFNFSSSDDYEHVLFLYPFRIFFNTSGDDRSPKKLEYNLNKNIPDYVLNIMDAFYRAYYIYTKEQNFKTPMHEGILFNKGAKFIDIMIVNIPVQKGLVSADPIDNHSYFKNIKKLHGKSIRVLLDRDLINNTATPIHELFHVFQYNYCSFNNMWFMEGLARWSQNLTHKRKMINEVLPSTKDEVEFLVSRTHDAEYFWREIISKCSNELQFVKILLEQCELQAKIIENSFQKDGRYKADNWTRDEKRSPLNNQYIFQAIIDTIDILKIKPDNELQAFIDIITKMIPAPRVHTVTITSENEKDLNKLEDIDSIDGDLILDSINTPSLGTFNKLKKVHTLIIKNCENLVDIIGFNALEDVKNIEISGNDSLKYIYGFSRLFKKNHSIDGHIKIVKNKQLKSVAFLRGLQSTASSLYLYQNDLTDLKGLEELKEVNASLSLSSNRLEDISALSNLNFVNGMLGLSNNRLKTLHGLENLKRLKTVKWSGVDRTININGNKELYDISALKNVTSSTNLITAYIDTDHEYTLRPDEGSNFYKNRFEIYDALNRTPLSKEKLFNENQNKEKKTKVLFSKSWTNTIKNLWWIEPYFMEFKEINEVVNFCNDNSIDLIFTQNIASQRFVHKHTDVLKKNGISFYINTIDTLNTLTNKKKFFKFMTKNSLEEYIPHYYTKIKNIEYPCIVKHKTGSNGRDVKIVYSFDELNEDDKQNVISEYIVGESEYATNLLYRDGKIVKDITYKKSYPESFYVLNSDSKKNIVDERIEDAFTSEFTKILNTICKKDEELLCCIDYKIKENKPKIFEINARLGFTLFRHPDDLKEMFDAIMNKKDEYSIVFADTWNKALKKCEWLNASHTDFKDVDNVIKHSREQSTNILFANNYSSQLFIFNNAKELNDAGLKFIVNSKKTLKNLVDKQLFYDIMLENGFGEYVPKYYDEIESVQYPCMVKIKSGGAGRGMFIADSKDDLKELKENMIISEYLPGNTEYATSIFSKDGKILKHATFSKTAKKDVYILQHEKQKNIEMQKCDTPFLKLFEKIVNVMSEGDKYCQCSINFKIKDGIPKIFEINPRIGYTLAKFPNEFKEIIECYIKEVEAN